MDVIGVLFRVLVGSVLLMSGMTKITSPRASVATVLGYRLLPKPISLLAGWSLPYAELGLATLLLLGLEPAMVGVVTALLLGMFVAAMLSAIVRRLNLTCTCFGLLYRERVGVKTVVRDGVLASAAVIVALVGEAAPPLVTMLSGSGSTVSLLLGFLTLLVAALSLALGIMAREKEVNPLARHIPSPASLR